MGFYIETPSSRGKASYICERYSAQLINYEEASRLIEYSIGKTAVIVVLDNGPFEAAGFAFSPAEFAAFTDPTDTRPKQFLAMPWSLAAGLTGYYCWQKKS